jgi:hypothetical protein
MSTPQPFFLVVFSHDVTGSQIIDSAKVVIEREIVTYRTLFHCDPPLGEGSSHRVGQSSLVDSRQIIVGSSPDDLTLDLAGSYKQVVVMNHPWPVETSSQEWHFESRTRNVRKFGQLLKIEVERHYA